MPLRCPFVEVSKPDKRAGDAEAKLCRTWGLRVDRFRSAGATGCRPRLANGERQLTGNLIRTLMQAVSVARSQSAQGTVKTEVLRTRRSPVPADGHFQSYDRSENRHATDRFQSTAAIGLRPVEHVRSRKSLTSLRGWSAPDASRTSAARSAEQALPTHTRSMSTDERSSCNERRLSRSGAGFSVPGRKPSSAYAAARQHR